MNGFSLALVALAVGILLWLSREDEPQAARPLDVSRHELAAAIPAGVLTALVFLALVAVALAGGSPAL